jgi:hypothetical protein
MGRNQDASASKAVILFETGPTKIQNHHESSRHKNIKNIQNIKNIKNMLKILPANHASH